MLPEKHQGFKIVRLEALPGHPMTEKEPADNPIGGVKRDDDFGREGIKGAPHDRSLRRVGVGKIRPADQVGMELKPADKRIALAVFDVVGFGQTTQPGAQAKAIALPDFRKNSYPSHAGRIGHIFHDAAEERLDVIEAAEHPGEAQKRHRRLRGAQAAAQPVARVRR